MTIQHSAITDPNIHEPKGISSAALGKIYRSNGSGSGTWVYPSGYVHGEIYIDAGVTSQTLAAASAYNKLDPGTEWTQGVLSVITATPADGELTLVEAGNYLINFYCHFSTAAATSGSLYNFKYALDGTTSGRTLTVSKFSNGADRLHVSATGIVTATAGQKLSIYVGGDANTSSTAITVLEAGLSAVRL
jgi:hypothetical protein